ncbi:B12-binding domain-containing radical SAM protein [Streptomyces albus]|uniref:B12-binding domain-containing radical SAM protein n=1 Tax=Streptomyces albus TaxID=1888 RepID=UPI0036F9B33A
MSLIERETDRIRAREIPLLPAARPPAIQTEDRLRMVFLFPYGHAYSLMANGPMALHDMINRRSDIPAVAERAIQYDCLTPDGNRLRTPGGEPYRSIESPLPVREADVVGVSLTHSGDLHSLLRLLDLAGIPRRSADRSPGLHPLVVGGNKGLANPEPLADYLDVVAIGEAEGALAELLRTVHAHRARPEGVLEHLARIPGLYVPALFERETAPGGGLHALHPRTPTIPAAVHPQYLRVEDLHPAHFLYPRTDGSAAGLHPVLGCRHSCHFCNLGLPPFRQAPLDMLTGYIDRLEELKVRTIILSAPTFTQYRHRRPLLDHIRSYARRAAAEGEKVTTIIGSVRADEITVDYLKDVTELGDVGHLFTELNLSKARGIVTLAPEWAAPDLVALYGKTQTRQKIDRAIDLCRDSDRVNSLMLYFIVGAPGERPEDRLAIAEYARDIHKQLDRPDGTVIVKLHQFMPKPGTPTQRLAMTDPEVVRGYGDQIRDRLRDLVGPRAFEDHFRVIYGETARMHLEVVCSRGDHRVGHALEDLYDAGTDLTALTKDQLADTLARHGLDYDRHLRHMDDAVLPWHALNHVNRSAEQHLSEALTRRVTE